ncbi:MAG TPA: serine/threonine-protein kinase, partial [Kofleriaceae bacterium]|nr:serine/threonine-protein kinase [Kofleriaceae bacterium]
MLDLSPDYAVDAVVGRGGMGTVYRARTAAGAPVAIKVLDHAADDALDRFSREVRTLAALRHPAVVAYLDHGARAGVHYLVTEWLEGETLADRLARDRLSVDDVLALARRVADALAACHARGIVHRDLKPSNLFLVGGAPAQVKLLDFGIAFVDGATHGNTRTGTLLGTPEYMAPEQARGERGIDARADVFSLGCVLYEALTASSPFRGDHMVGVLAKILFADPAPVDALCPEAPPALCDLITRMLAKDRRARPGDGAAVREHLDAISATHAAVAGAPGAGFAVTERNLVSVVVAAPRSATGPGSDPSNLPTVVDARPALARLRAAATAIDVAFEQLAEGAIVATVAGRAHAVDQAAAAARCAMTMRAELGPGAIAAATGLGVVAAGGLGDVIDRAVSLLAEHDEIRLDAPTAGLLDGRIDVRAGDRAFVHDGLADAVETTRRLLG